MPLSTQRLIIALMVLSVIGMVLATSMGTTGFYWAWLHQGFGNTEKNISLQILTDIRVPRALGSWLVGALLGLSGAIAQAFFRNPLADPYLLGSASGASLAVVSTLAYVGVGVSELSWLAGLGMTGVALIGALSAVLLTLVLAGGTDRMLRVLMSGIVVGVLLGALHSLLVLSKPSVFASLQSFMLGSTGYINGSGVIVLGMLWTSSLLLACVFSPVLDALALGEATATSLGVNTRWQRYWLIGLMSLSCAAAIAYAGLIGFVGLAAPHIGRALLHMNHRLLLLSSSLIGGLLLLTADMVARSPWLGQELPVGLVTAIVGGSYLLWRLYRSPPDQ